MKNSFYLYGVGRQINKNMWDRKEYDRVRARSIYEEFKNRRLVLFEKLGNKCFLCDKNAIVGFHLHHLNYHDTESNYPTHSKSMFIRLKRLKEAEENPCRFKLLCPSCHRLFHDIEYNLNNKKIDFSRLTTLFQL